MLLCKELQVVLRAGIDLRTSLENAGEFVDSRKLRRALLVVEQHAKGGAGLAEAFAEAGLFDRFFVGCVAAGEKSGDLSFVFDRLGEHYRDKINFRARFKQLIYPFIITLFTSGFFFFLAALAYYGLVENTSIPPDLLPRLLVSPLSVNYWTLLGLLLVAWKGGKFARRHFARTTYPIDRFALAIPVAGKILRLADMSRFSLFFSMLYHAGIPVNEALEHSEEIIRNTAIREEIEAIKEHLRQNLPLEDALDNARHCHETVIRAFRIGATTGNFEEPMQEAHRICRTQMEDTLDNFITVTKPLLMVGAALMLLANSGISSLGSIPLDRM